MDTIVQSIEKLNQEVAQIQILHRALRPDEMARLKSIHQALPLLQQALDVLNSETASYLITYKIVSDRDGKLKAGGRTACNFWNRFIAPKCPIVIRLGVFTELSNIIARAYKPYQNYGTVYGRVEFNTEYLDTFTENAISGTIVHEIGHTLGIGWDEWMALFDKQTGRFTAEAIEQLSALEEMHVETDYPQGTKYSHWDEERFGTELMTGIKDQSEHVLPVTVDIMRLFGHHVTEQLPEKTALKTLLDSLSQVVFSRKDEARAIDRDHLEETEIWEMIPHDEPLKTN